MNPKNLTISTLLFGLIISCINQSTYTQTKSNIEKTIKFSD